MLFSLSLLSLWAGGKEETYLDRAPLEVGVLHVNDTHSKFEPIQVKLTVDLGGTLGKKAVYAELGGYAQLPDGIRQAQARTPYNLFVHAGDFVQGSLYYTKYLGEADVAVWNTLGLDAATLGNHEFDKGSPVLKNNILTKVTFPVVSSNIDFSQDPVLRDSHTVPTLIKVIGGTRVGFVGLTTTDTPFISSPGDKVQFQDAVLSAQKAIDQLTALGVNKIIILSHLGYEGDKVLASQLTGADLVVGGHSHTLVGDFSALGLDSGRPYPTEVQGKDGGRTLVVQNWEWAKFLGYLKMSFDPEGRITTATGTPTALIGQRWFRIYDLPNSKGELKRVEFLTDGTNPPNIKEYDGKAYTLTPDGDSARVYLDALNRAKEALTASGKVTWVTPDPTVQALVEKYGAGVQELKSQIVAEVKSDLKRVLNQGPGPLIADSMRAATGSQIAVMNPGGVRTDLPQGPLSVAAVYEIQPFGNTLVTLTLPGSKVLGVLEDMTAFSLERPSNDNPYVYVSGIRFTLDPKKEKGQRISGAQVETPAGWVPLEQDKEYTMVVNNFMATGGDKNDTLKGAPGKYDTGFIDSEAFLSYVTGKTLEAAPPRITLVP